MPIQQLTPRNLILALLSAGLDLEECVSRNSFSKLPFAKINPAKSYQK